MKFQCMSHDNDLQSDSSVLSEELIDVLCQ